MESRIEAAGVGVATGVGHLILERVGPGTDEGEHRGSPSPSIVRPSVGGVLLRAMPHGLPEADFGDAERDEETVA